MLRLRQSSNTFRDDVIKAAPNENQANGINLFFDTEGASLRDGGNAMRQVPAVILLHGGPGADHSIYKPDFTALTDVAQVIYLDHRGNGRSDDGPPEPWTLAQWANDLVAFCDALGIMTPVVYGASFSGVVTYGIRDALSAARGQADDGGALDPKLPIKCQRDIAAALPQHPLRCREFGNCDHGVIPW